MFKKKKKKIKCVINIFYSILSRNVPENSCFFFKFACLHKIEIMICELSYVNDM